MKITLYKDCILTNSFSEVCDVFHKDENGKTTLDRYLDTLEKIVIDAGDVYYTNSGKFSFDMVDTGYEDTDFYVFNYMKFEDETNPSFKRFCFIDAIAVVNKIAVVSYIEDVWSCYASSMKMRKSLLTRSRIIDYGTWQVPFYSPGMDYQGNNQLRFSALSTLSGNVAVFAQVQLYNLSSEGVLSDRQVYNCRITKDDNTEFNIAGAVAKINELVKNSSAYEVKINEVAFKYEMFNFTIIPIEYCINSGEDVDFVISSKMNESAGLDQHVNLNVLKPALYSVTTFVKNVDCNFKQFKLGTFSNAFDIVQNGSSIFVSIEQRNTPLETFFYLKFQNQIIDITSSFSYTVPITVQTADATQQQATAREIKNLNAKLGIASGAMKIAGGIVDVGLGASLVNISSSWSKKIKGAGEITSGLTSIGGGIMNVIGSAKQLDFANRAMYVTNRGTAVSNTAIINAVYGVILYEIQPDNEVEVQANIDNTGYLCNEIVDNLLETISTGQTNKYNVMQFEYVNIYGAFTQRIADALRDILYSGFKIWYDETTI